LGDAAEEKGVGKTKAKVDDKRPGMKLFKGKYIHSTLKLELFHPQVSALMG